MMDTLTISKKDEFLTHFDQTDFSFDAEFSKEKRTAAKQAIQQLEFPTSKTEYWKYTRINKVIKGNYKLDYPNSDIEIDLSIPTKNCIVLVNGYYVESLSWFSANNGLHFSSLSEAKAESKLMPSYFDTLAKNNEDIFAAINTAYHQDGAFLHLEKNTKAEEPIYIINITDSEGAIANPRNLIVMEEGSEAKVVLKTISTKKGVSFTNMVSEIFVAPNANLEVNKIQDEGEENFQITTEQVKQDRDSVFNINTFTLSGALVRNNLNVDLLGVNTESHLNGLYLLKGKQHVDNHTILFHREPNCLSNELYKGIIDDSATGVFNGRILVHREAQKTLAFQSNANMLLTDDATINSKPELEIYADDVKCSHGSTIGQLDEEALFYLRSRGVSEKNARAILLNAFASDILEHVTVEAVKEELIAFIDENYQGIK